MTRVFRGMVAVCLLAPTTVAAAATDPQIKVSREADRVTVTLHAGELRATETVTRSAVDLRLEADVDVVWFSADLAGRVTVARGEQQRTFSVRDANVADQEALRQMLQESRALATFDALLRSAWAVTPQATLFTSTRAVIRALQGDGTTMAAIAVGRLPASTSIRLVRQRMTPAQCYDTYARDVIHFTYELQACIASLPSQWWNPLATWFCAYEYNLKSSLAAVWLFDCYGVGV